MATRKRAQGGGRPTAGKSYPDDVRAEGLRMFAAGVPIKEIAQRLGTSLQTPRNWINAARKAGADVGGPVIRRRRRRRSVAPVSAPSASPVSAAPRASRDAVLLMEIKAAIRKYIAGLEL